ncbi:peptidase M48, Ste24p [Luminiphilus syltensis NOR5-1B]|uniref:Peptidase M48, Ste24p n=1 Tax=Luminiphilus syltensis NOR5-1B TaxID=565045 RepID=B8KW31_9GAMM|nr:M48 family metalloprotease [Luminiphilus syltensis]EED35378.1 peptidase M48, Ste24p [Luminiphilus syltensis NOR5-1B]
MSRLLTVFFVLALTACGSTSTVSVGGRAVEVPSVTAEEHEKLLASIGIYDDPELAEYINRIGQRLVANSSMPDAEFTFTLLDSPDINAFALPGGFIYVNRGLLAYLETEAELAGVISHEIGHITENHHGRRKSQQMTSTVVSTTAYILTGSGELYDAAQMYGAEVISGFGREMELEADAAGAEFMHRAGYDADALLSVIGVLKDQEMYRRAQAKASGKPTGTYHGLYASHPRNDLRLQTVIRTANTLDIDEQAEDPAQPGEFRRQIEGMVFGASAQAQGEENRYYHNKLSFTFEHPKGWTVKAGAQAIVATSPDGTSEMTITLTRRDEALSTEETLKGGAKGELSELRELDKFGLTGTTAIASSNGVSKRLGVIDHKYRYLFEGSSNDFAANDPALTTIIESFRPLSPRERVTGESRTLHYVQVPRGATMETLSSSARISNAEDQLRLINGYYPSGEPRIGDWVKIIR